ncbi:hypothetical protein HYV84_07205 [Candidatus Woesearchaeota archaeon]|nr:hypothetical protein [Candidatus Woesearchaeota archaeon]
MVLDASGGGGNYSGPSNQADDRIDFLNKQALRHVEGIRGVMPVPSVEELEQMVETRRTSQNPFPEKVVVVEAKAEALRDYLAGPGSRRNMVIVPTLRIYQLARVRGDDIPPIERGEFHLKGYDPHNGHVVNGHFARVEFLFVQPENHFVPFHSSLVPLRPTKNDLGYDPFATIQLSDDILTSGRFLRFRPDSYEPQLLEMLFGHPVKN